MAALVKLGKSVSLPFGDGEAYDMILDNEGKLQRLQCKLGRWKCGAVVFHTSRRIRKSKNSDWGMKGYAGEIDAFAVYCPRLDKVYIVPQSVAGATYTNLRVDPALSNRTKGVHLASEFELGAVVKRDHTTMALSE